MKTTKFKAFMILVGLMLVNISTSKANTIDNFKKFASDQVASFNLQGLLIIGGIIAASLIIYIITNHVMKEKDEDVVGQNNHNVGKHNHERYHHRHIVKKTS